MEYHKDLSSFVIQPYRRKYLAEYCKRMSTDNLGVLFDDNVASVLKEQGFTITESPRSVYKVEKLYDSLAKYSPKNAPQIDLDNEYVKDGVNLAYTCFGRPKSEQPLDLQEFTPEYIYSITSNHQGSAGLTAWGQTKAESYVRAYERGLQQLNGIKRPEPCVAFKRTQFNDKTRLVWGYPYAMTAIEGLFARPLIERFKRGGSPMAFGKSTGMLGAELRVSSYHKRYAYSTDVSSYDSSIGEGLIHIAFQILKTWFSLDKEIPGTESTYLKAWNDVEWYFIHTPIFMPDGNVYKGKKHGVPSGSYFTQMIDSVVNVILVGAVSSAFKLHVSKEDIYVLGDDILFWSNRLVSLEDITQFASSRFNMKFNASKSNLFQFSDTIHYLGRDWTDGVPSISQDEIIIRMSQPERFRKYPKDEIERKRAVRLLLLSYAAVYKEAYPVYLRCLDIRPRYGQMNATIENYAYGSRDGDISPDFLSGLQRFMLKYVNNNTGSRVPLALQFWK